MTEHTTPSPSQEWIDAVARRDFSVYTEVKADDRPAGTPIPKRISQAEAEAKHQAHAEARRLRRGQ